MAAPALINRYAHALIHGAAAKGFDAGTIYQTLDIPLLEVDGLEDLPVKPEMMERFFRRYLSGNDGGVDERQGREIRFGPEDFAHLQRNLKWLTQDDFYGLTATPCKVGSFLVMAELVLASNTLGAALQRGFRFYETVTDDLNFSLHEGEHIAEIHMRLADPQRDPLHFHSEWWPLIWHRFSCWLIGEPIPILRADFPHPPAAPLEEYTQVFSPDCRFEQPLSRIRFNSHFLGKHCVRSQDDLKVFIAEAHSFDLISIPGMDKPLAPRIEVQLQHHFTESRDFPGMEDIAREYHMSSQTLRRRLDDEGTSFREIKEKIRRQAVMAWLADSSIPISEVVRMSGFAEANGLSRAVKAWIGESPSEYRGRIEREQRADKPS